MSKTEYPQIAQLETDMREHGEVHAVIEELGERDLRQSTTYFNYEAGILTVEVENTTWRVGMDRVIAHYKPRNF